MTCVGIRVLAAQCAHLDAVLVHERRGHVVLGRERVRRAQRDLSARGGQREHQVRGLGGDVEARRQPNSVEGALLGEPLADLCQHRHLPARPRDPGYACRRES